MRTPLFTKNQIIAKGIELTQELGREPSAWEIHKALGGKGNVSRVKEIWDNREATPASGQTDANFLLPSGFEEQTDTVFTAFRQDLGQVLSAALANAQSSNNRLTALAERDRQEQVDGLRAEIDYLTAVLEDREKEITELSVALARAKPPKPASPKPPSKAKPAAQKSPRRASRTAPLVNPKGQGSSREPRPKPGQEDSR